MIVRTKCNLQKDRVIARATLFKAMRNFLEDRGFIETHTPIIHHRPDYPVDSHFTITTIENHIVTYLRTCMELRLRQVLLTGVESVYEIGPCFRNEKKSEKPSEFYMMECFKESIKFEELISLSEEICKHCARSLNIKMSDDKWPRISINELFISDEIQEMRSRSQYVQSFIKLFDRKLKNKLEEINEKIFFLIDYPVETISIAQRKKRCSNSIERFELFVNNLEVAHGFVDCIDPQDLQSRMNEIGWSDEPLLELLKSKKLPPSGGVGIGMERLLQSLCEIENIYEIIIPEAIQIFNHKEE